MPRHATKTSFKKGVPQDPAIIAKRTETMKRQFSDGTRRKNPRKGAVHPQSSPIGTRRVRYDGYVAIKVDHSGSWPYEHRWVWEQANGRKLTRGEVIHHIDGNPGNNAIENLMLMTHGQHSAHTSRTMKRTQQPRCVVCGHRHPPH